jgi:hypothetical protein
MGEQIKADGIRRALAILKEAQRVHAAVGLKIDAVDSDLHHIETELAVAREELKREEEAFAMSGSRVPDELSPVERRIPRIEKKQRIIRTRRGIYEQELKAAEASMGAAGEAVKKEWRMVGLQCVESLRTRYRAAAAALKAAYVEYSLWTWEFPYEEDRRDFPVPRHCPVVCDVGQFRTFDILIQPRELVRREDLEALAPDFMSRIGAMKAEINAVHPGLIKVREAREGGLGQLPAMLASKPVCI